MCDACGVFDVDPWQFPTKKKFSFVDVNKTANKIYICANKKLYYTLIWYVAFVLPFCIVQNISTTFTTTLYLLNKIRPFGNNSKCLYIHSFFFFFSLSEHLKFGPIHWCENLHLSFFYMIMVLAEFLSNIYREINDEKNKQSDAAMWRFVCFLFLSF